MDKVNKLIVYLILGLIVCLTLWFTYWLSANKINKMSSELNSKTIMLDILNKKVSKYKDDSARLVSVVNIYEVEKQHYMDVIADGDSIQRIMHSHIAAMNIKLKNLQLIVSGVTISQDSVPAVVNDINPVVNNGYDKHLHYSNTYDTIEVFINSTNWDSYFNYSVSDRIYIANDVNERDKYIWKWIGVNWNIFGFGKRVKRLHIKGENPNTKIDRVFTVILK